MFYALAAEMQERGKMKNLKWLSYDINQLGYSDRLGQSLEHPNMLFYPGKHREKSAKIYKGDPSLDTMANYIKKYADNKIKADFSGLQDSFMHRMQMQQMTDQAMAIKNGDPNKMTMDELEYELQRRGEL